ncbi:MAG: thioredoxin domain-containing protein [Rhodospirillaceae bacterium]
MPNRLAQETSPYLRQHAENPVDWFPWGEEAFRTAREEDKPVLLSIGYSACHWCHVMAHESFEDPEVAAEMNRHFVNVKVDREERPDLDHIYQTAHQLLTRRSGGWPLTLVLTPEGTPFFAGTYFPKTPRYGMPGFKDLLVRIAEVYATQRKEIGQQNEALLGALRHTTPAPADNREPQRMPVDQAVRQLAQIFDDVNGGLGQAPKFPHPHELAYCLRRHALDGGEIALTIVRLTLTRMAQGGIYDQIGGGFCRYSVDAHWHIPHFEKMLYDNGPLLALYADAWRVTRDPLFERVARETAAWAMREMQAPEGGYYSSLDADSEHEEGKFYVWSPDEVRALLSLEEYRVVAAHYGLGGPANFEGRHWHLRVAKSLPAVANQLGMPLATCEALLESARQRMYTAREQRVRPGRDEKILTSWNGLMIRGMVRAARVWNNGEWLASARAALDFIRSTLWRAPAAGERGRLLATYKDGKPHLNAYLDDHAFLLDALIETMQMDFQPRDLEFARALADTLLDQFEDREHGGFYFVSHDHEQLIHRAKTGADNATPSGNGIAAIALQRLGHLVGETRYLEAAERAVRLFYPMLEQNPSAHVSLLTALEEYLAPPAIVILRGDTASMLSWQGSLSATYRPDALIFAVPAGVPQLPMALDKPAAPSVQAWICKGARCLPPVQDLSELAAALERARTAD